MRGIAPVLLVLAVLCVVWYGAAVWLNLDQARALADDDASGGASGRDIVLASLALDRPLLPAPHQIALELLRSSLFYPPDSPRSLLHHTWVTAETALAGFALALCFGTALALGIVRFRVLDRSLMLWIIASQTVPVLAIAPMVVVVLGNLGFTGLVPKALIAGWLSFFPITIGMVKGLRSPDPMQRDLLRSYCASEAQMFRLLRLPASIGFLFPSMKLAASLALVGAIVAELPTGAQAGLGARLLTGSYYGQTMQIWAALVMAALLAMAAIALVDLAEAMLRRSRGGRL